MIVVKFRGGPLDGAQRQVEPASTVYEIQMEPFVRLGRRQVEYRTGVYRRRGGGDFVFVGSRDGGVR